MKSRAERLRYILERLHNAEMAEGDAYDSIIALFKECVPKKINPMLKAVACYWNECREETLKNIEEMGK